MKVGRRDEKRGRRSNTTHSLCFFSSPFPTRRVPFLIPPFVALKSLKSSLYLTPICQILPAPSPLTASNSNSLAPCRLSRETAAQGSIRAHAVCLVTASHPPPRPLKVSLSVCDRDAGLISTDAKDLKVSLRISQRSRTTAEEQRRRKRREGRGGGGRERPRV